MFLEGPGTFREKTVVKLQFTCFEMLIMPNQEDFQVWHGGFKPRPFEDIRVILAPEIDTKSFGTFEKQAPGHFW